MQKVKKVDRNYSQFAECMICIWDITVALSYMGSHNSGSFDFIFTKILSRGDTGLPKKNAYFHIFYFYVLLIWHVYL